MAYDYQLLRVEIENRIAWVTVDAPPINVITLPLYAELSALSKELKADPNLTVVVLKSADPDFFLAHFDVSAILQFPTDAPAQRDPELNDYHAMCERFRTMDKVTIAQIEGRVGGGGSELVVVVRHALRRARQDQDQSDGSAARHPARRHRYAAIAASRRSRPRDGDHPRRRRSRRRNGGAVGLSEPNIRRRAKSAPSWRRWRAGLRRSRSKRCGSRKRASTTPRNRFPKDCPTKRILFQRTLRTEGAQRNMKRFLEMGGQTREGELKVGELMAKVAEAVTVRQLELLSDKLVFEADVDGVPGSPLVLLLHGFPQTSHSVAASAAGAGARGLFCGGAESARLFAARATGARSKTTRRTC